MPTDTKHLKNTLDNASSFMQLPEGIQSSVEQILKTIHQEKKSKPLKAAKLREEAGIDTHRYGPLLRWLEKHDYCSATWIRKKSENSWKKVTLTESGAILLKHREKIGRLKTIALRLRLAKGSDEEMNCVKELVAEAFVVAYSEFYFSGKTEQFRGFRGGIEDDIRKRLDAEIGDTKQLIHEVYLTVRTQPKHLRLDDAKKAREKGHHLTENHEYVLQRTREMKEKDIIEHNINWIRRNAKSDTFNPTQIVEHERKERSPQGITPHPSMTFVRDSFNLERWMPEIIKVQNERKKQQGQ